MLRVLRPEDGVLGVESDAMIVRERGESRRPSAALLAWLAPVLLSLLPVHVQAAAPAVGEILVLNRTGANGPTVYAITMNNAVGNTLRVIAESPDFGTEMAAVAAGLQKRVYVASGSTSEPRIHAYDPYTISGGAIVGSYEHPYLAHIVDLVADGHGGLYLLDGRADPLGEGYVGAIYHLDPATGQFELVISAPHFTDPTSLARGPGGTLLVLDPTGRLVPGGPLRGAVYRVDPQAHSITALCALDAITMRPEAIELLDPETFLLVDSNFIVPGMATAGGAVLKLSTVTGAVLDTLALAEFGDPSDVTVDIEGNVIVMDLAAQVPSGKALFRIHSRTGALLGQRFENPNFGSLVGLSCVVGSELDQSTFSYQKVNGFPPVIPGDRLRWTATLRNTGTSATGDFDLLAMFGSLLPLLGTQSYSSGEFAYDPARNWVTWSGALEPDGEAIVMIDLRVPEGGEIGGSLGTRFTVTGDSVRLEKNLPITIDSATEPGDIIVADPGTPGSPTLSTPRLFRRLDADHTQRVYWDPVKLPNPVDLDFGTDGLLYVLDGTAGHNRIVRLDPRTPAGAVTLFEGAPLENAQGLCLGHNGTLMIADPKTVNLQPALNQPGVIYQYDPVTGGMAEFFSDESMLDPVGIAPDTQGGYVVCDYRYVSGANAYGRIYELDGEGRLLRAEPIGGPMLRDPVSAAVAPDHTIYIADARIGTNPDRGAIVRVRRPNGPGEPYYLSELVGSSNTLLVDPWGIKLADLDHDGDALDILLCDRNPIVTAGERPVLQLIEDQGTYGSPTSWVLEDSLRNPHRSARRELPQPEVVNFTLEGTTGGTVGPGDQPTLRMIFQNASYTPALGVTAILSYPPALRVHSFTHDQEQGVVYSSPSTGTLHWTGDLAFIDPVDIKVVFEVDPYVQHRDTLQVSLEILGVEPTVRASTTAEVRGALGGGELIVLDATADPFGTMMDHGTLYVADLDEQRLLPYFPDVAEASAADIYPMSADEMLVVDKTVRSYSGTGAVLKCNLRSGERTVWAYSSYFRAPTRIIPAPEGGYMILDEAADLSLPPARGAIYRVEADGSGLQVAAYSRAFRWVTDMTFDSQGRLWVADMTADPLGLGTDTGALFRLEQQGGTGIYAVVDTVASPDLVSPQGLLWVDGRGLLFTDPGWDNGYGETGVRLYNPIADSISVVATHHMLVTPRRMIRSSDREVLIIDQRAAGLYNERGVLFALDLFDSPPGYRIAATGTSTEALLSVVRIPGPEAGLVFFGADEDAQGRWTQRGDTLHCEIRIANISGTMEPAAALQMTASEHLLLEPAGASASAGELAMAADGLTWQGAVAGLDTVTIRYQAYVLSTPDLSPFADQRATLTCADGSTSSARLTYYISTVINSGDHLLVDRTADPLEYGGNPGAVYRVSIPASGYSRSLVPLFASPETVTLVDVALIPGSKSQVLLVDANGPRGNQNRGALFRADTRTGVVEVVCRTQAFAEPRAVAVVDSTLCFLLDEGADPFNLIPGPQAPGAVFRIDLEQGTAEPVFSDTILASPVDMLLDPPTGRLVILNRAGGESGEKAGRVLVVDPLSGAYEVIREGDPFVEPRAFALDGEGRLAIIDFGTSATEGLLYSLAMDGSYEARALFNGLRLPTGVLVDHYRRTYVVDANADPAGFGMATGTVFWVQGTSSAGEIYLSGPPLGDPRAMETYFDPVPIQLSEFALSETPDGVRIGWRAPEGLSGADYYVYRRDTADAGQGWLLLNPRRPVRGAGALVYLDAAVGQGCTYEYMLVAALPNGANLEFGPLSIEVRLPVSRLELQPIQPDPVRLGGAGAGLTLRFRVPAKGGIVTLDLFDVTGRRLNRLADGFHEGGSHVLFWDGRDAAGAPVASGVYYLRLASRGRTQEQRFVLLR